MTKKDFDNHDYKLGSVEDKYTKVSTSTPEM